MMNDDAFLQRVKTVTKALERMSCLVYRLCCKAFIFWSVWGHKYENTIETAYTEDNTSLSLSLYLMSLAWRSAAEMTRIYHVQNHDIPGNAYQISKEKLSW